MGAAWLYQWGSPMAWAIAAQWLQVFSGGPGQPLGWASRAQPGSGAPGPKWSGGEKQGAALPWGPSIDELKSIEDPFGGTGLAGARPLQVGVGRGMLLDWVSSEGGKKESPSLLPRPRPGQNRTGQPQAKP